MPDYKTVSRPASLKASPVSAEDAHVLDRGHEGVIGTDLTGETCALQLDLRWHEGRTFVSAMRGDQVLHSWTLAGRVTPTDARSHYLANLSTLQV